MHIFSSAASHFSHLGLCLMLSLYLLKEWLLNTLAPISVVKPLLENFLFAKPSKLYQSYLLFFVVCRFTTASHSPKVMQEF